MTETTTIAHTFHTNGMLAGRIVREDDYMYDHLYDSVDIFLQLSVRGIYTRVYWNNQVSEDFYHSGHGDSRISVAWDRYLDENTGEGARELFTRYMRAFHPLTPFYTEVVTTGYSQGDNVGLVLWAEPESDSTSDNYPRYMWAADMHHVLRTTAEQIGAFTRGQFLSVTYETAVFSDVLVGEDEASVSGEIMWEVSDTVSGVFYTEEFEPDAEALETAKSHFYLDNVIIVDVS